MHVVNRKSSLIDVLKTAWLFTLSHQNQLYMMLAARNIGTSQNRHTILHLFPAWSNSSIFCSQGFRWKCSPIYPVSSQLYIWSEVNFSFTIKSCNSAIKLFPASTSDDSFSPTMLS
ncbi:hypothetical protein AVEN_37728-1 [Araneus ventricosus]|uniref:Uncharacterized protein n=1 Tax=Araneus ventricosus TaxID=182803 RepID=A0A4Y2BVY1_ARAVE|nr:hypothetical protein AVEN_37728-1 [Araneus ventricosus]